MQVGIRKPSHIKVLLCQGGRSEVCGAQVFCNTSGRSLYHFQRWFCHVVSAGPVRYSKEWSCFPLRWPLLRPSGCWQHRQTGEAAEWSARPAPEDFQAARQPNHIARVTILKTCGRNLVYGIMPNIAYCLVWYLPYERVHPPVQGEATPPSSLYGPLPIRWLSQPGALRTSMSACRHQAAGSHLHARRD